MQLMQYDFQTMDPTNFKKEEIMPPDFPIPPNIILPNLLKNHIRRQALIQHHIDNPSSPRTRIVIANLMNTKTYHAPRDQEQEVPPTIFSQTDSTSIPTNTKQSKQQTLLHFSETLQTSSLLPRKNPKLMWSKSMCKVNVVLSFFPQNRTELQKLYHRNELESHTSVSVVFSCKDDDKDRIKALQKSKADLAEEDYVGVSSRLSMYIFSSSADVEVCISNRKKDMDVWIAEQISIWNADALLEMERKKRAVIACEIEVVVEVEKKSAGIVPTTPKLGVPKIAAVGPTVGLGVNVGWETLVKRRASNVLGMPTIFKPLAPCVTEDTENLLFSDINVNEKILLKSKLGFLDTPERKGQIKECEEIFAVLNKKGIVLSQKTIEKAIVRPEEIIKKVTRKPKKKSKADKVISSSYSSKKYSDSKPPHNLLKQSQLDLSSLTATKKKYSRPRQSNRQKSIISSSSTSSSSTLLSSYASSTVGVDENLLRISRAHQKTVNSAKLRRRLQRLQNRNSKDWFNFPNIVARPVNHAELEILENLAEGNEKKPVVNSWWRADEYKDLREKLVQRNTIRREKAHRRERLVKTLQKNSSNGTRQDFKNKSNIISVRTQKSLNDDHITKKPNESQQYVDQIENYISRTSSAGAGGCWFPSKSQVPQSGVISDAIFGGAIRNWANSAASVTVGLGTSSKVGSASMRTHSRVQSFIPPVVSSTSEVLHVQEIYGKYRPTIL